MYVAEQPAMTDAAQLLEITDTGEDVEVFANGASAWI